MSYEQNHDTTNNLAVHTGENHKNTGADAPASPRLGTTETQVEYYPCATPESEALFRKNIASLAARSRMTAIRVLGTQPTQRIDFVDATDGSVSATYSPDDAMPSRRLASAHRPIDEAQRFADAIDIEAHATIAVVGFALGHHLAALVQRVPQATVVLCYEPDIALLRAVLEKVDCAEWLQRVIVVSDATDVSELAQATKGLEGLMGMGTHIVEHAPSAPRLTDSSGQFREALEQVMRAVRTTMATTMVQIETTMRNLTMNIDRYALGPGIEDLHNIVKTPENSKFSPNGRPAIVVSAGPSLARNIELLKDPIVQERFVIIAVQTVLKQLLDLGIKPHFVTALDRHKISERFYEGLTEQDVQGVQLVVEPKCNPVIPERFPGVVRCASDEVLDKLLGENLYRKHGSIKPGATVSHLAYYLARYLGCDPVILIGQDLGFTDNQYYSAGASIHDVWSCELGEFTTLESLEYQRIMRSRQVLSMRTDHLGRAIYTEEQLHTYLLQFERDFLLDTKCGMRVIDATEGGVRKANTETETLQNTIQTHMPDGTMHIPMADRTVRTKGITLDAVNARLREVRNDTWHVENASRDAMKLLDTIVSKLDRSESADNEIQRVQELAQEVVAHAPAYDLVHHLNQTGTFRRVRDDRSLETTGKIDKIEVQRKQVTRDHSNVRWLCDAAVRFGAMLDASITCLEGGKRQWEEMPERVASFANINFGSNTCDADGDGPPKREIAAVVVADFARGALGKERSLDDDMGCGMSALACTLTRIAHAKTIDRVAILTDDPRRAQAISESVPLSDLPLEIQVFSIIDADWRERRNAVASARAFNASSWRGGIGQLTVWDEMCTGTDTLRIMDKMQLDSVVLVEGDWALIDPAMIDDTVMRLRSSFSMSRRAFAPAPAGLGPIAIDRGIVEQLVSIRDSSGVFATLGSTLGYVPIKPSFDPIAHDLCASVSSSVRDLGVRCAADSRVGAQLMSRVIEHLGNQPNENWAAASAEGVARTIKELIEHEASLQPVRTIDIAVVERCPSGPIVSIDQDTVGRVVELAKAQDCVVCVTLRGADGIDALAHPEIDSLIYTARNAGAASVHVRSRLVGADVQSGFTVERFVQLAPGAMPDVVSAELLSTERDRADIVLELAVRDGIVCEEAVGDPETDHVENDMLEAAGSPIGSPVGSPVGSQWHADQHGALDVLLARRSKHGGLPVPWIVARLLKRDATYLDTELFYNTWIMRTGTAVLDPLKAVRDGGARSVTEERVSALPLPKSMRERVQRESVCITPSTGADVLIELKSGQSTDSGVAA